jgi:hypothetical protein
MPSNVPATLAPRGLYRDAWAFDTCAMGKITLSGSGSSQVELRDDNRMSGEQGRQVMFYCKLLSWGLCGRIVGFL